jgi:membrane associated rhomboid family serine protease
MRAGLLSLTSGYPADVPTRGDKVFAVVAIVIGLGMAIVGLTGLFVSYWVTIGATVAVIIWLAIVRRRPPEKRTYRTHL